MNKREVSWKNALLKVFAPDKTNVLSTLVLVMIVFTTLFTCQPFIIDPGGLQFPCGGVSMFIFNTNFQLFSFQSLLLIGLLYLFTALTLARFKINK